MGGKEIYREAKLILKHVFPCLARYEAANAKMKQQVEQYRREKDAAQKALGEIVARLGRASIQPPDAPMETFELRLQFSPRLFADAQFGEMEFIARHVAMQVESEIVRARFVTSTQYRPYQFSLGGK